MRIDRVLWAATVLLLAAAAWTLRARSARMAPVGGAPAHPALWLERPNGDSLMLAASAITDGNLFRTNRGTSDPSSAPVPPAGAVMPKPQLVLRGLVGGPPWEVLVEGLPGREGTTVLRMGQEVSGVTATSVRRGRAILRGYDTVWALTFRPAP